MFEYECISIVYVVIVTLLLVPSVEAINNRSMNNSIYTIWNIFEIKEVCTTETNA